MNINTKEIKETLNKLVHTIENTSKEELSGDLIYCHVLINVLIKDIQEVDKKATIVLKLKEIEGELDYERYNKTIRKKLVFSAISLFK
jgi:hypothetical protein